MSNPIASESGHWYTRDGRTAYTVVGKNGRERNTTLADARKLDLVPSVTTITRMAAAPALEKWKIQQALLAALRLPRNSDESEKMWADRVYEDSRQQAYMTADRGSAIHGEIERLLQCREPDTELRPYADAAMAAVYERYPNIAWETERSFASPLGFGGKVDLHAANPGIVLDFKSKDGSLDNVKCWPEHFMQLVAYARGLGLEDAKCANVFITRSRPIEVKIIEHSVEDTIKGWRSFLALLEFFKAKNGL